MDTDTKWAMNEVLPNIKHNLEKQALVPVSHSKLSLLLSCPKAYNYTYVDKIERKDADGVIDTNVGTFIHEVLEKVVPALYIRKKTNMSEPLDMDLIWASIINSNTKRPLTSLELDKAEEMRDNVYDIATRVVDMLLQEHLNVEVEYYIGLDKGLKSFKKQHFTQTFIHGYIDLFGVSTNNPKCLLLDYKTYARGSETDSKVREQLEIYAILLFLKYPHIQYIEAGVAYIPDNLIVTVPIMRDELRNMLTRYELKVDKAIDTLRKEYDVAKPGTHCKWCSFKYKCTSK